MTNDDKWLISYNKLVDYYKKFGHSDVRQRYVTSDGFKLGMWLSNQKTAYKKGKLSKKRFELLNKLNVNWYKDSSLNWYKLYSKLCQYYKENGNIDVKQHYITKDGYELGKWLSSQRQSYKRGTLVKEKIKLLEKLNIKWSIDYLYQIDWHNNYERLCNYYNEYGNTKVSLKYLDENGYSLGYWVYNQRRYYRSGKLTKNQISLLNDINFDWSPWDTAFLKSDIVFRNKVKYRKIMLSRMKEILEHLSLSEIDCNISDLDKQKELEKEIIKRMWR